MKSPRESPNFVKDITENDEELIKTYKLIILFLQPANIFLHNKKSLIKIKNHSSRIFAKLLVICSML